ncbi:MAG TPA: hypothetical protein VK762_08630 [Polyangiaceae bacterium]|nr:hypothetical protein [Polyangiaceae bacterium]
MNRSRVVPAAAALTWVVLAACTVTPSTPPDLGSCDADGGAPCGAGAVGGGGTSGGGDGGTSSSTCSVSAGDSQCDQCASSSCCPSFAACTQSADCENLLRCEQSCAGAAGCTTNCQSQSPNGVGLLNTLTACIDVRCPVCSQFGVGDPCVAQASTCNPGLSCSGLWCTKACTRSTDCEGLGAGGGNALGLPNACMLTTAAGRQCVPGCQTDADCTSFPGSFCFATTSADGLSVQVCTPPPDAGAD